MTLEEYKNEIKEILIKDYKRSETQATNLINHNTKYIEMLYEDEIRLSPNEVARVLSFILYETTFKK